MKVVPRSGKLRVAILWSELSGYVQACLKVLQEKYSVELLVIRIIREKSSEQAHPYDESLFSGIPNMHILPVNLDDQSRLVFSQLELFEPTLAIISGWSIPIYRSAAIWLRQRGVFVIGSCDTPWRGTVRQWAGMLSAPLFVQKLFDALWVPGARAAQLGRRLGFDGDRLLTGLYTCDSSLFTPIAQWRLDQSSETSGWPARFLFTGLLIERKGVPELLEAYRLYRQCVAEPWELWCVGSGPLTPIVQQTPGAVSLGFIQPSAYPDILKQVGAFILPSRFDPWPLAIHEATSAGLPILCSQQCGNSVELVREAQNGFLFQSGDIRGLAELMERLSRDHASCVALGKQSIELAAYYSPERWASQLVKYLSKRQLIAPIDVGAIY